MFISDKQHNLSSSGCNLVCRPAAAPLLVWWCWRDARWDRGGAGLVVLERGLACAAGVAFHSGRRTAREKTAARAAQGRHVDCTAPAFRHRACTRARARSLTGGALSAQTKAAATRIQELLDRGTTVCSRETPLPRLPLLSRVRFLHREQNPLTPCRVPAARRAGHPAWREAARVQRPKYAIIRPSRPCPHDHEPSPASLSARLV